MQKQYAPDAVTKNRHAQTRAEFAKRPSLRTLLATGEYTAPIPQQDFLQLRQLATQLKHARETAQLSLADLADKSGVDRGAIWKLESGRQENPTIETLIKIARALGLQLGFQLKQSKM